MKRKKKTNKQTRNLVEKGEGGMRHDGLRGVDEIPGTNPPRGEDASAGGVGEGHLDRRGQSGRAAVPGGGGVGGGAVEIGWAGEG